MANAAVQLEFLVNLAGLFLRGSGVGRALKKGGVLFLVTTSTLPSLQAYVELHALSSLRESISP